jgi:hypothetical protein
VEEDVLDDEPLPVVCTAGGIDQKGIGGMFRECEWEGSPG